MICLIKTYKLYKVYRDPYTRESGSPPINSVIKLYTSQIKIIIA